MSRKKYVKDTFLYVEIFKTLNVSTAQVSKETVETVSRIKFNFVSKELQFAH